ncbi:Na(+)/H(+) antiporter subunit C [Gordonia phthalatica]|uniref:Cation:proton antiporter n=1 Tax=Gordonia phthalatica TaxID=1136941 RepID=A0A0N9NFQ6_9ACTN|nr:Na(+)/H(+) antiporter subunit C [Gordonia phthalatica]ALG86536.1 cation:proton antiporter [Gordonia phthalatica]
MAVNLGLLIVVGVMAAGGVYLLTERSLIRMLFGLLLVGNALNLLIVVLAGPPGHPPIRGRESLGQSFDTDPLAQGMVLTAIVLTLGIAAFILALAYRLFQINRASEEEQPLPGQEIATEDELGDDEEDVKILTGSFESLPDRDRSDDPTTGADTVVGDLFDTRGNPMTAEEFIAAHINVHEPDLMPEDADVLEHLPDDGDEMPADSDSPDDDTGDDDDAADSDDEGEVKR